MKTPLTYCPSIASYSWQPETLAAFQAVTDQAPRTVAARDARLSFDHAEPVLVILDAAIAWAKAYRARFEQPLADDYMARDEFASIISGARALLNFDGARKMKRDARDLDNPRSDWTDSKENGMLESLYWEACRIAGLDGEAI